MDFNIANYHVMQGSYLYSNDPDVPVKREKKHRLNQKYTGEKTINDINETTEQQLTLLITFQ